MSLPMRSASLTLPRLMSRSGGAKPIITGHPGDGGKLDGAAASPPPLDGAATMRAPNRRQSSVLNLKNIPEPPIVLDENYIFSTPDSAENIVFATTEAAAADGIPVIRGGTLAKLVERLTYDKYADTNYLQQFLLTYRTFTTPAELLDLLTERFDMPNPIKATDWQIQQHQRVQRVVRLRVFNVLKLWLDKQFEDFADDAELLLQVSSLTEKLATAGMQKSADFILDLLKRKRSEWEARSPARPLAPLSAANAGSKPALSIISQPPAEVARQLTLIEFNIYRAIMPSELTSLGWMKGSKDDKWARSPHIMALTDRFNHVAAWTTSTILFEPEADGRKQALIFFLQLAKNLRDINNFNGMMAVVSGLTVTSVRRLKKLWSGVDKQLQAALADMEALMSRENNFAAIRNALRSIAPPALPYPGLFLTDLAFIDSGNSDLLPGTELINFYKRRLLSQVIRDIQQYQQQPYSFQRVEGLADALESLVIRTEDECYAQSLKVEPREEPSKGATPTTGRTTPTTPIAASSPTQPTAPAAAAPTSAPATATTPRPSSAATPVPASAVPAAAATAAAVPSRTTLVGADGWPRLPLDYPPDYPFREPDSPANIQFMDIDEAQQQYTVRAGTLPKLVERLTHPTRADAEHTAAFLLTFRSFATPRELLYLLMQRFQVPPPLNSSSDDKARFRQEHVIPVRMRVLNALKTWVDRYYLQDFVQDRALLTAVVNFGNEQNKAAYGPPVDMAIDVLRKLLRKKLQDQLATEPRPVVRWPADPRGDMAGSGWLQNIPAVAEKLAEAHRTAFLALSVPELCTFLLARTRQEYTGPAPLPADLEVLAERAAASQVDLSLFAAEAIAFCAHLERLSRWVASAVLLADSLADRAEVAARLIVLAETARKQGDLATLIAIMDGLSSAPARRLECMWTFFSERYSRPAQKLAEMQRMAAIRRGGELPPLLQQQIRRSPEQAITMHLWPYMQRLTAYAADADEITVEGNARLINMEKRQRIAVVLEQLQQLQRGPDAHAPLTIKAEVFASLPQSADSWSRLDEMATLANESDLMDKMSGTGVKPTTMGRSASAELEALAKPTPRTAPLAATNAEAGDGDDEMARTAAVVDLLSDHQFRKEIREAAVNAIIGNVFKEAWWLLQHQQQQRQLRQHSQTPGGTGADGAADGEEELQLEGIDDHVAMLRGEVSDESSLLLVKWNLLSPSQQVALELSVAQQRFPGCAVETWTANDDEGAVYGWPTQGLWLTTVQESNGPLHLMTLCPTLSMADLAIFIRKAQLYVARQKVDWYSVGKTVLVPLAGVSTAVRDQAAAYGVYLASPANIAAEVKDA